MNEQFTDKELSEFTRLVELGESRNQLDRIESRVGMPPFISRVGRKKCDAMFEAIKHK